MEMMDKGMRLTQDDREMIRMDKRGDNQRSSNKKWVSLIAIQVKGDEIRDKKKPVVSNTSMF